jgi:hypothetical protein
MCSAGSGQPEPNPDNSDVRCTEIRNITDIVGNTITLDAPLDNHHPIGQAVGVEFVNYLWYSDVDSGTVFFHDHVDFTNWDHGLFGAHIIEPTGSTWHDPTTGAEIRSGALADIRTPATASIGFDQQGSFREQMLFVHNTRASGGSTATLNMASAPLGERDGTFPYSSVVNGDPRTPIVRAYLGDSVVIRGLGVVERISALRVTGHRFRMERFLGDSELDDTIHLGISEREDLVMEVGAGGAAGQPGDYMYHSTKATELDAGAWGILRVHDTEQGDLQPLPDVDLPPAGPGFPQQTVTGLPPINSIDPGNPCPPAAPTRLWEVWLSEDPLSGRQFFALAGQESGIINGTLPFQPLVLRANDGDCLQIGVSNRTNDRAGFNVSKLLFDPQGSHGTAIGFNADSTIDSGVRRVQRFYADQELGTSMFSNIADPGRTGLVGGYGAIVIEPAGSTWRDPLDGSSVPSGPVADVLLADGSGFREQVILMNDEDERIGQSEMPYPTQVAGFTGINYGIDPFFTDLLTGRAQVAPSESVYDSDVHGDPMTVLNAYVGDPVVFRVGVGSGLQSHSFGVNGHRFPWEPAIPESESLDVLALLPGEAFDMWLTDGAGAGVETAADYLFENRRMPFHEAGLWGILRTHDTPQPDLMVLTQPGYLRTTTVPAVPSQITVDGIPRDTWSTEWVKIQPGTYEVCFSDVPGFTAPPCEVVDVQSLQTTTVVGNFTARGFLQVGTSPALPATISVDGAPRNDWGMWTDLEPGSYEVCYGAVAGFDAPACETVNVVAGANTSVVGTYTPGTGLAPTGVGLLRATVSPALPAQIIVDGVPRDTWSLAWLKLPIGPHDVCFSGIEGFTAPSCQVVVISEGATTFAEGIYTQRGFLRVDTAPATPSTIIVDDVPRDDWGMWTHLEAGSYEVCFSASTVVSTPPPCQTAIVAAGLTTTVTGSF